MDPVLDARLLRFRSRPEVEDARALARELLDVGRGAEAIEVAVEALKERPEDATLLVTLGRALFGSGDLVRAQAVLMEAAKTAPGSVEPYRYLGEVLLRRNEAQRAAKVLGRALAIDPRDPSVRTLHEKAVRLTRGSTPSPPNPAANAASAAAVPERKAPSSVDVKAPAPTAAVEAEPAAPAPRPAPVKAPPAGLWGSRAPAAPAVTPPAAALPAAAPPVAPTEGAARTPNVPLAPKAPDAPKAPRPRSKTMMGIGLGAKPEEGPLKLKHSSEPPKPQPQDAPPAPVVTKPVAPRQVQAPQVLVAPPQPVHPAQPIQPATRVAPLQPVASPPPASPVPIAQPQSRASEPQTAEAPSRRSSSGSDRAPDEPATRVSSRPPKATVRGIGDSEPPTAVRAPAYDPKSDALLLGGLKTQTPSSPGARTPSVPGDLGPPPGAFVPTAPERTSPQPRVADDGGDTGSDVEPRFDDASPGPVMRTPTPPRYEAADRERASAPAPAVTSKAPERGPVAAPVEPDFAEVDTSTAPVSAADERGGDSLGAPDSVDAVLRTLKEQGLFEQASGADPAWAKRKDLPPQGTRTGRTMLVLWAFGLVLAVGGYFGFQAWLGQRHAQADRLVAESAAHALAGEHKDLVDAERKLRFARDLKPHDDAVTRVLLFVETQRALEEGAFEAGFLRATVASAEKKGLKGAELDLARAIIAASEGKHAEASALTTAARAASPKDGRVLYVAGRLAQRLGDDGAVGLLEEASKSPPAPLASRVALAEAYADDGRRDESLAELAEVLKARPGHLRASLWNALVRVDEVAVDAGLKEQETIAAKLKVGAPTDHVLAALLRARLLRRKGDDKGASDSVDVAVRAGAEEPRLLALVAAEARSVGLVTRAQGAAMDAVARAPMNADFRKLLADILLDQRDGVRALRQLEGLSTEDPSVLEMSAEAALLVGTDKVLGAAAAMLGKYVADHKDAGVRVRALALRLEAALGKSSAVLPQVRALKKANPQEPAALAALGEVALLAGETKDARAALRELVRLSPQDADAYYWLGRAERADGDGVAAEASLRKSVELSPLHLAARRALGRLLLDTGKFEEADKLYEALARAGGVAQGETSVIVGRVGRAEALLGLGRVADASALLESLGAEDKTDPQVAEALALVRMAQGKPGEAVAGLRPLAEAPGAVPGTVALYGQALFEAGDSNNANKQFDRALAADSELPEALLGKGQTALRAERAKDAHKALDLAEAALKVRVRPGRTLALLYTLRGRAFLLEGRSKVEPARTVLRSAVAIPGAPTEAHFFLGESLAAANSPEAYEAYAKYLSLEPNGEFTKRAERAMRRK